MEFDSQSIAALAEDIGGGLSGARLHGALVGGLCGGAAHSAGWELVLESALGDVPISAWLPELRQMLALTEAALADPEFGFEPLLPEWEVPLAARVQALADWCDSFILAWSAAAGDADHGAVSDESGELLADLTAIAGGLDPAAMEADEDDEDEGDYMQILEFVRVAALNLYAERHPVAAADADPDTVLH